VAGIQEAMRRVADQKNIGRVVAKGNLSNVCSCEKKGCPLCDEVTYIIIKLKDDNGIITAFNVGDISISDDVSVGDVVILMILNNWSAEWQKKKSVGISYSHIDPQPANGY